MVSREDFLGQQSDHTRSRNRCNKTKITHQLSLAAKPCSLSRSDHNRQIRYLSLPPLSKRESCFSDLLWSRRNRRTAPLHSCRQTLPFSYQQPLFYQNNTTHIEKNISISKNQLHNSLKVCMITYMESGKVKLSIALSREEKDLKHVVKP